MGPQVDYESFLKKLDEKLKTYFKSFEGDICCQKGCSDCCEVGDYPLSDIELKYLIKGYMNLDSDLKIKVQNNFKNMKKGGCCPFLVNKICSIYDYRPIVCRVHGLAYMTGNGVVKVPYCANSGKSFSKKYADGIYTGEPIMENLETAALLSDFEPVIKNLYDWINTTLFK